MLPCGSNSRSSPPLGCSGLSTGIGMSFTAPVLGSSTPTNWWPKSEYQALPSASTITSCGMRLFARQVVFGDDDAGGAALRTRQRLELVFGRLGIAEAEAREIFRRGLGGVAGDGAGARRAAPAAAVADGSGSSPANSATCAGTPARIRPGCASTSAPAAGYGSRRTWSGTPSAWARPAGCSAIRRSTIA